ncbi:tetratricopeptide repeat protein [Hyphococcus sp.]|uniref:tetratricopeptide repeat protein n=1 Tax=Hyphococcus sp. TaxID=2038636 RepID=UPI003CCB7C5C
MKKMFLIALAGMAIAHAPAWAQTQDEANAKFAAQDWTGAAADYKALLDDDPSNAQNWYNLARALHQSEDVEGARDAYLKALEAGVQSAAGAHYHLARAYMALGDEKAAMEQLETLAEVGGVPGRFVENTAEFAELAGDDRFKKIVIALTPCTDEEYRHFDFWLGEWDVTSAGAAQPTASSKISSQQNGCVILEEYTAGGFTGMSINFYDSVTERWHQSWMSNAGAAVYLEGGLDEDGAMVMSDEGMTTNEVTGNIGRTTWTPNKDGSVRQLWEQSTDGGASWNVVFDGTYTRKESKE